MQHLTYSKHPTNSMFARFILTRERAMSELIKSESNARKKIVVTDMMRAVEKPYSSLSERISSVCVRSQWLSASGSITDTFSRECLAVIFEYGCNGVSLDDVIYRSPPEIVKLVKNKLELKAAPLANKKEPNATEAREIELLKQALTGIKTFDTLETYFFVEWLTDRIGAFHLN